MMRLFRAAAVALCTGITAIVPWGDASALRLQDDTRSAGVMTPHAFPASDERYLRWPLSPELKQYGRIDGSRLKSWVNEITAISRSSRDAGERFWGRISGTKYDHLTEQWVEDRFRQFGLSNVRRQWFDLPPQWFPVTWHITATDGGKTLTLESARPATRSPATPDGGMELEPVWVGLGTDADIIGRNLQGKLAVIHSVPLPGAISHSAGIIGAVRRVQEHGASAIVIALAIAGNAQTQLNVTANVPTFSIGSEDARSLRALMETRQPVKVRAMLSTEMRAGLRDASVWGEIPGTGDENVIVMAHHDAYFEGALNNASGMAVLVALADYFSGSAPSTRRRTIKLVASQGHHSGSLGTKWMSDNRETFLRNTALIINAEHVAVAQSYVRGNALRTANQASALRWWVFGSEKLAAIALDAYRSFGVAVYHGMETDAPGDMASVSRLAPSIQLMETPVFYQTDLDTPAVVPAAGLEAAARAFAKIIDDTGGLAKAELIGPGRIRP